MKFHTTTITITTKLGEGSPERNTVITLTESDIGDQVVADALVSGQSPRVRYQNALRKSGKIPETDEMTWSEWIVPTRKVTRVVVEQMSPEQIRAEALKQASANADERAKLIAELLAMNEQDETK